MTFSLKALPQTIYLTLGFHTQSYICLYFVLFLLFIKEFLSIHNILEKKTIWMQHYNKNQI